MGRKSKYYKRRLLGSLTRSKNVVVSIPSTTSTGKPSKRKNNLTLSISQPVAATASKALSKSAYKAVTQIVDRKMDQAVEDKFLLDSAYIGSAHLFNNISRSLIREITPTIPQGTGDSERIGSQIKMKRLSIQFRLIPRFQNHKLPTDATLLTITANPWQQPTQPLKIFIVKVDRLYCDNILVLNDLLDELRTIVLPVKFKEAGTWTQDIVTSTGHGAKQTVRKMGSCDLQVKYRSTSVRVWEPVTSANYVQVLSAGQLSHKYLNIKIDTKWQLNIGNQDSKFRYFMYVQFANNYNNYVYNRGGALQPHEFSHRFLWVYEDA